MMCRAALALLPMCALASAEPVPSLADDWNINIGMPQQSGYGFCKGGKYVGISDATSKLQLGCARLCDKEGTEGGRPKCAGFSAREMNPDIRSRGFYYYCYNCPSLTKADIDCTCRHCKKTQLDAPYPYRIYARKSTKGFSWFYDFEKDGCASDLNADALGRQQNQTALNQTEFVI